VEHLRHINIFVNESQLYLVLQNVPYTETGTEVSKYEKVQYIEESKTNTSSGDNGDENSGGPFDQVIINF